MELSKQIKKYRTEANLSQEELADKIYVSRQTISNWENEKNYPDIKSLVLMSEVFQVSLDNLVKRNWKTAVKSCKGS
ncbi:XRE family transcriptional regulator [Lachnospira eligens]|jgi:transcriptional regulator with XRE-family HTH domain|uniref:XRE family transcriptional regulator n=1 Tax=Lachnospira eligens TaxID=39485 RepID=A0A413YRN6_9FIRM|nr:helix-turn-helix transcriptional regulator [Lachnospira eligens]RHC11743.1 XRE family transcriptional regulator [Lachnospira eligens]